MKKFLFRALAFMLMLAGAIFIAHQVSPWPSVLVYRTLMDRGGVAMNEALQKHVPPGVTATTDLSYDDAHSAGRLDVYKPAAIENSDKALPAIVWIHGGAFLSGDKSQIANYLRILAARGYVTIGVNYALAPTARYPDPLRQINTALGYVLKNASALNIDPAMIFLAGDSAGAQLAAQTAILMTEPTHAQALGITPAVPREHLRGVILHCGLHDPESLSTDGMFGGFVQTTTWSYLGAKNVATFAKLAEFSIVRSITAAFPPMFISAGNADPLEPQSVRLAERAASLGVKIDALFFPKEYTPPLGHEYQFDLDGEAGKQALERSALFLAAHSGP